ncbi:glycerol dehydrogenase [Paenibacillus sp. MMS20-IR301]|uniref:glycerol dehydrogenase n=1 Tax=Paenibacillus sp. MMS20-IR301 TaxID=2895946 RepID=UPI0028EA33E2|nr:glycerol dehydrogenase [Paenibacillus sp. MMS20-IR301]WNS46120.1 glycerol dehydrogenase [Paenibacillus sp. MMS20-IR301]
MPQIICSPSKYIQGSGEIRRLGEYCLQLGVKGAYAIVDPYIQSIYGQEISGSFDAEQIPLTLREFRGECSLIQVQQITAELDRSRVEVIVGVGGGKTLDTAKAVSYFASLPVLLVPTVASTDAPCSALSVLYSESGEFDRYLQLRRSPDVVVADTAIIAKAPVRLLAAGMGDALSTYYEARACSKSAAVTSAGGTSTLAALALARTCLETLFTDGRQALKDASAGQATAAVEHIVEANIYLSGIGFESGGLAAAHAIHNGLTLLPECRAALHGEKVAFATLVQLMLEGEAEEEISKVADFCRMAGLPVTLAELGLAGVEQERLMMAAEASCAEGSPMMNMPFSVTPKQVLEAFLAADRRGARASGHC